MVAFFTQLLLDIRSRFSRRARLETENLLLRQQLIVLRRQHPKRVLLWNIDRLLMVIRRGSFRSVPQLVRKIDQYVSHHNRHKRPFAWTATADSILDKLQRLCILINGTLH